MLAAVEDHLVNETAQQRLAFRVGRARVRPDLRQTAGEADYNAQTAMYGGYSRAAGLMDSAKGRRMSGNASLLGSVIGGFGSMAGGLSKSGVFG